MAAVPQKIIDRMAEIEGEREQLREEQIGIEDKIAQLKSHWDKREATLQELQVEFGHLQFAVDAITGGDVIEIEEAETEPFDDLVDLQAETGKSEVWAAPAEPSAPEVGIEPSAPVPGGLSLRPAPRDYVFGQFSENMDNLLLAIRANPGADNATLMTSVPGLEYQGFGSVLGKLRRGGWIERGENRRWFPRPQSLRSVESDSVVPDDDVETPKGPKPLVLRAYPYPFGSDVDRDAVYTAIKDNPGASIDVVWAAVPSSLPGKSRGAQISRLARSGWIYRGENGNWYAAPMENEALPAEPYDAGAKHPIELKDNPGRDFVYQVVCEISGGATWESLLEELEARGTEIAPKVVSIYLSHLARAQKIEKTPQGRWQKREAVE